MANFKIIRIRNSNKKNCLQSMKYTDYNKKRKTNLD